MVRRPAALAMALALAAAAAVPSRGGDLPDENCVRILRDARIAAIAGDREKAKTLVQRAVEEYPKEALPAVALVQLARTGSPAEAKDARERLQARLFASDAALPIAAIRYLAEDPLATREDTILLRDAVRHGLEKAPSDPKLLETAYRLAVRNGDSADALAIVDRQLAASATPDLLRRKLAVLANLSRRSEAEPIARELVASNPKRYPERQALIDALVGQGKLDAARAEIDAAIAAMALTAPNDWVSFRLLLPLGWAFRDAGRDAESRQTFQRALDFSAENTEARDVLLRVLVSPQERAEKEAAADQRWQGEKEPIRLFEEGTKRLAAGDATSAFEMLQRAVHAYPTDDVWQYNLAMAAIKLQRWPEAEAALRKSIELKPDRAASLLQLGRVLDAQDRCDRALEPLRRALALDPAQNEAHFYLYKCLGKLGDAAGAAAEAKIYEAGKKKTP